MKTIFTTAIVIAMVVFFIMPSKIFAGGNDTLVVYANDASSLDQIINGDTAHNVFKLVSLDTTYLYLAPISARNNLTIIGALGSNGRPPCIQPGILSNGSLPQTFLLVKNPSSRVTVKNLYLFGRSFNNTWTGGPAMIISSDSTKLYMDNIVVDEYHGNLIVYSALMDDFFITNCKFRNSVWPANWTSPGVIRAQYPTQNPVDTVIMDYNTFFCYESNGIATGHNNPQSYMEFNHNTMIYNFEFPIGTDVQYADNIKIENNIFYGVYAGAVKYSKYHAYYYQKGFAPVSCIQFDTLSLANAKLFDPADSSNPNVILLAEAKRVAVVNNNLYYQPQAITDFWTAWNDTAHVDSLITPMWMNPETQNMFNDKKTWPGFEQSGNLVNVDPIFGTSFQSVLQSNSTPGVVSLQQFITEVQTGVIKTDEWGYQKETVTGNNWIPAWPLPESQDMQYTNTALKTASTDGKPLGDPGWFTGGYTGVKEVQSQLPNKFELYQSYPNPFNPSTIIKFTLAKAGNVSLKVYNIMGQLVKTIVNNVYKNQGDYNYQVTMDNLSSGVYFYTLTQGEQQMTKKMILLK